MLRYRLRGTAAVKVNYSLPASDAMRLPRCRAKSEAKALCGGRRSPLSVVGIRDGHKTVAVTRSVARWAYRPDADRKLGCLLWPFATGATLARSHAHAESKLWLTTCTERPDSLGIGPLSTATAAVRHVWKSGGRNLRAVARKLQ
jgi:hypothetical protein